MSDLIFEQKGIVRWGNNAPVTWNYTTGAFAWMFRKIKIFSDRIEFYEMWRKRILPLSKLDFVEIRTPIEAWFAHHEDIEKFLSFTSLNEKDMKELIEILKSFDIKIKKGKGLKINA